MVFTALATIGIFFLALLLATGLLLWLVPHIRRLEQRATYRDWVAAGKPR